MLAAVSEANDLYVMAKYTVAGLFLEDVKAYLDEQELIVTVDDFQNSGWREAVNTASEHGHFSYWDSFSKVARKAMGLGFLESVYEKRLLIELWKAGPIAKGFRFSRNTG